METKSFSCHIRNNIAEISFLESLMYVRKIKIRNTTSSVKKGA